MAAPKGNQYALGNNGGKPAFYDSVESLQNAIQAYFDGQIKDGLPITISGLAYALGFVSRQSLYDYKEKEEFAYIIKRATFFVESQYEGKLSGNNPTGSIFALKNMGWKDKTEQDLNVSGGITWHEERTYEKPGPDEFKDGGSSLDTGL